ncbi:serine/threonine protein kinase [Haloactinopolyspora alba]|uniref:Serine/threonine protein kinase n=1 Tax=Haloactinopolyspora alba TaxID=648780 RepID=A0A2P8EF95_9ACTN|nr:serine/threonine protein kinase [Haloactinopolyspora alba]PSL08138.1 serine/threonine protein kinase [Haloactinopolyspora alba]
MVRIVPIGRPVNDAERAVIAHLRDHGPAEWTVLHSLEIPDSQGRLFEVDLVVVTGHMVYVIDVKGTFGRIDVQGSRWMPAGRSPFHTPLPKLRENAKRLKSLLEDTHPQLSRVYVDAVVVLPARDARLVDHNTPQRDAAATVNLQHLVTLLSDASRVPTGSFSVDADIERNHEKIVEEVKRIGQVPTGPLQFGNWLVLDTLSETIHAGGIDVVGEYRAKNANAVQGSGTVRLVVRQPDLYAPTREREKKQKQIGIAYEALGKLPPHPAIVGVKDFFPDPEDRGFVTVYDDIPGHALRLHLGEKPVEPLTRDRKLLILRQVLTGLAHAQSRKIVHRALNPATILLTQDGRAMIIGFDYAKTAQMRAHTVALDAHAAADHAYLAPEAMEIPTKMTDKADIYAVGVIGFEMLSGHLPFESVTEQVKAGGALPEKDLEQADVPSPLRHWLSLLCAAKPEDRPDAREAIRRLNLAIGEVNRPRRRVTGGNGGEPPTPPDHARAEGNDEKRRDPQYWRNLPRDFALGTKYIVQQRLGKPGASGVAYRVFDTMRNVDRVIKLILRDGEGTRERARREGMVLSRLQDATAHPNVVRMFDVDVLPKPHPYPFLVFEFVTGEDLGEVIRGGTLTPGDVRRIGIDVAEGLKYLHGLDVWHCDIKPGNLLWTEDGVKILDFGIAKTPESTQGHTASTPRYTPPDLDQVPASTAGYIDRDLYALGITLYEALTNAYPWDGASTPPLAVAAEDPRERFALPGVTPELVKTILKAISPERGGRFSGAEEFLTALKAAAEPPKPAMPEPVKPDPVVVSSSDGVAQGHNPFVAYLQTLYSQSRRSNRGTRGMDAADVRVYVPTGLDLALTPSVLAGAHSLVIVTGNAGDGKTAFLESLAATARERGATFTSERANGADFELNGRRFDTNYDGSQDEDGVVSDDVLTEFFAPFAGADEVGVLTGETRLIAVNEGRLVDFLSHHPEEFAALTRVVEVGLRGEDDEPGPVAVVNLNLRDVTVRPADTLNGEGSNNSILERMLDSLVRPEFWSACEGCALFEGCYARQNAATIAHPVVGPQIKERMRRIYEIAQLRGRLHITLRDLRSALAYTLTSGRDCAEIHDLYEAKESRLILASHYFNAYRGGDTVIERDRLLNQLHQVDVARSPQPVLDRRLASEGLLKHYLVSASDRITPERDLLRAMHPEVNGADANADEIIEFVSAARRLSYFEMRDPVEAVKMLPYASVQSFLELLDGKRPVPTELFLEALNRSEGVVSPELAAGGLVIRIRDVVRGTVRSLRRFPGDGFRAGRVGTDAHPYLETRPTALRLTYIDPGRQNIPPAELRIGLDLFELIERFRRGYQASIDDDQGYALALTVFKNQLAAVPYDEVLLTVDGSAMHTVRRSDDGVLHLITQEALVPETEDAEWR